MSINDLDEVCARVGIDRAAYHTFPLTLWSRESEEVPLLTLKHVARQQIDPGEVASDPAATNLQDRRRVLAIEPRSHVLSAVFRDGDPPAPGVDLAAPRAITVLAAAGGAGSTSIAAALARVFSARGRRVQLFDGAAESLLPLYLGATGPLAELSSFHPQRDSAQGAISVRACGIGQERGQDETLWLQVREATASAGDIIVDPGPNLSPEGFRFATSATVCLVVLVPDIRCALRVRDLERKLAAYGPGHAALYLLNRFDAAIPLHREMRTSLSGQLGERLLPLMIRPCEQFAQALAEGMTVTDYAPGSGAADELTQLADWLQAARAPAGFRHAAIAR